VVRIWNTNFLNHKGLSVLFFAFFFLTTIHVRENVAM
jgi:hypothetical protein